MKTRQQALTQKDVRELLDYNRETGIFIWKPRDASWFESEHRCKIWNTRYAGKRAGNFNHRSGSRTISIFGKSNQESRLAWMWIKGEDPGPSMIEFINGDPTDLRFCNLRLSDGQGLSNKFKRKTNKSGIPGVFFHKSAGKYCATVRHNKKQHNLGYYESKEEAEKAAMEFRAKHGIPVRQGYSSKPTIED